MNANSNQPTNGPDRRPTAAAADAVPATGLPATEETIVVKNASTINVFTPETISYLLAQAERQGYLRCREEEEVVDIKDVSEMFKVTLSTIRRWIEKDEIPRPARLGEKIYWTKRQLIDHIHGAVPRQKAS